ncbi:MAG TPA: epoxyqueuosine reductase QueH [Bacillota bacterium]|nr:MAG: hypothetical protein BWY00_01395 [Firmicutes bacterium ADurb.Bin153]HNV35311.1 epoxyqueuosine reductase QueH [Bacillota bacterium]HPU95908.1 epoxyqueuosine reductase QueH [Bacillota bacterium]
MNGSILVHACCAPCSTASVAKLASMGERPYLYFYNPNIHPYTEFRSRLDSFLAFLETCGFGGEADRNYGLETFIGCMKDMDKPGRCRCCYRTRLGAAARRAASLGIGRFTTTLTISPYQNHELIIEEGNRAAQDAGIEYVYLDMRPEYRKSRQMARDAGYYMQKYCGCAFSEADRFDPSRGGTMK